MIVRRIATFALACTLLAPLSVAATQQSMGHSHDVYPFLGVDWGGNTFVGAAMPFGMVKVGPDMQSFDGVPSNFGYMSGGAIVGFSHLHLSGAAGKYGNILVMPTTGELSLTKTQSPRSDEENHPGYYAATLTRYNVRAELTATRRVAMHRYTFLSDSPAHLTVDIEHCLTKGTGWESQRFLGGEVHVVSPNEVTGFGRYTGGWNRGGEYRVYFDMVLNTRADSVRTWSGAQLSEAASASAGNDGQLGASFDLHPRARQIVKAKVGISFISIDQAKNNIAEEAPLWDFEGLRRKVTESWDKQLAAIELRGATAEQKTKVYTALYHTMLMPSDRTEENPDWPTSYPDHPYYDDYYAIWDTFRSSAPLLTLIAPDRERDLIRSLIDIYKHTGYMPDARSGNDNGRTQGGSNANVMVADAYVKSLGGIDYETAFQAMLKDASVPPADKQKEGRGGILDYNAKGFVTLADERSGSRTVEYAYDDFAIAEVACGLHHESDAETFAKRANNWSNLWDKDLTREGFKGFLRPRNPDGTFADPYFVVRGTWPDFFYEGDLWTYSFYAPQDMRKVIELAGGDKTFVTRLDYIFRRQHFDVSNEPGFLMPVMYNWALRPDKTAEVVTQLLEKWFTSGRAGIPGNDDSGAMSSWFLFNSIGFYPNSGQPVYLIGTPSYPDVTISVGKTRTLHIVARNLDEQHINRYVQSVTLNGQPVEKNWLTHEQVANGGTLIFTMGSAPSAWGTQDPPPSPSYTSSDSCKDGEIR
ncbi:GH92 family glycosyl hydrolase [Silvibacterium acidisoli]|uniref:GH92 family glycosyl hydrolase n=1 Tax=Acidobacteriaceae bacterium ZG23-2 TaxID=2883246 RepID=UPI00406C7836